MTVTREGKGLLLTTVLVGLAALNTGNNLIYLLLALMMALGISGYISGLRNISGLKAEAFVPEPVYAGTSASVRFQLTSTRRKPAFLVQMKLEQPAARALVDRINPETITEVEDTVRFEKRGKHRVDNGVFFTSFPFGFFRFSRPLSGDRDFIVYPELVDVRRLLDRFNRASGTGTIPSPAGDDFTDLRPYRPGDRLRDIHWKATAKTGEMVVREFRAGITDRVTLILDDTPGGDPAVFEKAVSLTASLVVALFEQGYMVKLVTSRDHTPYCTDRDRLCGLMDILALVQQNATHPPIPQNIEGSLSILVLSHSAARPTGTETEVIYADSV